MKQNQLKNTDNSKTQQVLYKTLFLDSLTVTLALGSAIAMGESPGLHFEEEGFITYVSCLQLLIAAILAGKIFGRERATHNFKTAKSELFWLIISIGLFFLALDDALEIHENIDLWLHSFFDFQETNFTDFADDIVVGGYVLLFLVYIAKKWQTIQVYKPSFRFFKIGFILTVVMIIFDLVSNNDYFTSLFLEDPAQGRVIRQVLGVLEDILKIFAEGIFIVGIYKCWQIVSK
jgi:hypothetical protein